MTSRELRARIRALPTAPENLCNALQDLLIDLDRDLRDAIGRALALADTPERDQDDEWYAKRNELAALTDRTVVYVVEDDNEGRALQRALAKLRTEHPNATIADVRIRRIGDGEPD